jgi:ATPase subunit of ABC transporter with duplicated ATPase domains
VRDAESDLRRQRRDRQAAETAAARRRRQGRALSADGSQPKVMQDQKKNAAEKSAGAAMGRHADDVDRARARLDEAETGLRDDQEIRVQLPDTTVPSTRVVLTMTGVELAHTGRQVDLEVRGPERVAVVGANGAGKTTLLRTALGEIDPALGQVRLHVPARHLSQRLDLLDPRRTIVENVRDAAPGAEENAVRSQLARFLFRGRLADRQVATLSGGELLRATLATVLLAEPAPQLLVLDEPTNNLDVVSTRHLVDALRSYRGALLVVSHDERFLAEIDLTRRVWL